MKSAKRSSWCRWRLLIHHSLRMWACGRQSWSSVCRKFRGHSTSWSRSCGRSVPSTGRTTTTCSRSVFSSVRRCQIGPIAANRYALPHRLSGPFRPLFVLMPRSARLDHTCPTFTCSDRCLPRPSSERLDGYSEPARTGCTPCATRRRDPRGAPRPKGRPRQPTCPCPPRESARSPTTGPLRQRVASIAGNASIGPR